LQRIQQEKPNGFISPLAAINLGDNCVTLMPPSNGMGVIPERYEDRKNGKVEILRRQ
jgi:hypothetical protein